MKLKHTPGPWIKMSFALQEEIVNQHGEQIAKLSAYHYGSPEEMRANVILMTAAPEMVDCLIGELRANIRRFGLETTKRLNMCHVIERATGLSIEEVLEATE
jgi:hypothetical protein